MSASNARALVAGGYVNKIEDLSHFMRYRFMDLVKIREPKSVPDPEAAINRSLFDAIAEAMIMLDEHNKLL